jgi:peptidoglycan/xylan/chitin deacetylase (PgdA/CDA1 family)
MTARHACALLYHDVVPRGRPDLSGFQSPDADIYKFSVEEFDQHLSAIAEQLSGPMVAGAALRAPMGDRPTLITFDDGGASGLRIADMLESRGWIGHFFVTTDVIGSPGFMDEAALRDLRRRGHVVGSHSASHPPRMSACTRAQLDREWATSVRRLADVLGEPVEVASVPGGYYSREVAVSAAAAGVRVLFNSEPVTSVHEVEGCLVVGRFGVQQGVSAAWAAAVVRGDRAPRAIRWVQWNGKKALKRLGGEAWLAARRRLIATRARRGTAA